MSESTKAKWAALRMGIYGLTSAILKYLGIKGWVDDKEGQALLLIVSAVLDLAFFMVLPFFKKEELGSERDAVGPL